MNGLNMNNFILGFAIARPLAEQRDRLMVGLAASMFNNPMGAFFLKGPVDTIVAKETETVSLRGQLAGANALLTIKGSGELSVGGKETITVALPSPLEITTLPDGLVKASYDAATATLTIEGLKPGTADINLKSTAWERRVQRTVLSQTGASSGATKRSAAKKKAKAAAKP